MRILHIITRSVHGGAQSHVLELINGFRNRNEMALVVGDNGFLASESRALEIPVFILSQLTQRINPIMDFRAISDFRSFLKKFKPDIVHAHSTKAGLVARASCWLEGVPIVFSAHGWAFTEGGKFLNQFLAVPLEFLAARVTDRIICGSAYDFSLAMRYGIASEAKMSLVYNGISDTEIQARYEPYASTCVTMVARFSPPKDFSTCLRALPYLEDCHFQFVGDGELRAEVEALATHLGVEGRVQFLGSRSDIPQLLANSNVFVLVSHYEGLPISILEAMRCGLPVVASDVGGISEAVIDNVTGFLIPRNNHDLLVARLRYLIANPEIATRFGVAGRELYEKSFSLNSMMNNIDNIYRQVLEAK